MMDFSVSIRLFTSIYQPDFTWIRNYMIMMSRISHPLVCVCMCVEETNSLQHFLIHIWMESYIWDTHFLLQSVRWVFGYYIV